MFRYNLIVGIGVGAFAVGLTWQPAFSYVEPHSGLTQREIDIGAITEWLAREYDCEEPSDYASIGIDTLEYYSFSQHGTGDLVVVASTCNTGTAGPDVHSVFVRNGRNDFIEYKAPEVDGKYFRGMVGNRNYDLTVDPTVEGGLLVETYYDSSGSKESPLIIKYKWVGDGFATVSMIPSESNKR